MLVFFIFGKQVAERESLSTLRLVLIICSHAEHCNINQMKNKNCFFPELLTSAMKMDVQTQIWTWLAWKSSGGSITGQRIGNARSSLSSEMREIYILLLKRKEIHSESKQWLNCGSLFCEAVKICVLLCESSLERIVLRQWLQEGSGLLCYAELALWLANRYFYWWGIWKKKPSGLFHCMWEGTMILLLGQQ